MSDFKSEPSAGGPNSLQRGKACLRCRKRKMRCDGTRPTCQQCIRSKKSDSCEYDDGKGKTRTQLMREHISRLEHRVRELEDPDQASPSVLLHDPHAHYRSGSSSSSDASSPANTTLTTASPYRLNRSASPYTPSGLAQFQAASPSASPYLDPFISPEDIQPPAALAQMLLDIFLPHRHQLGLELYVDRLRDSIALPPSEQRHPVLMNAIYMWSCFLSRPAPLSQYEPLYLGRTLEALNEALQYPHRLVDAVRGSCLLAQYFFCNGRHVEGTYHAGAAAALAMRWDLHRAPSQALWDPTGQVKMDMPKDPMEEGERIAAFWQVYNLDRCWSAALSRPSAIAADKESTIFVDVPWPQSMEEYQSCQVDDAHDVHTIREFLDGQGPNMRGGFSTQALRAKSSALFGNCTQMASTVDPKKHNLADLSTADVPAFAAMDATITRFVSTLLPMHQLDAAVPEVKHALLAIHSVAQASVIRLTKPFVSGSPVAHDKTVRAARSIVAIIKHIMEVDYDFLDPIIGACWVSAADVLFLEATRLETSWPLVSSAEVRGELGLILYALTQLSSRFPVIVPLASQVQAGLAAI